MKPSLPSKIVQTVGHLYCGLVAVIASFIIKVFFNAEACRRGESTSLAKLRGQGSTPSKQAKGRATKKEGHTLLEFQRSSIMLC